MSEGTNVGSIYYDLNLDDKKFQEAKGRVISGNNELGGSFSRLVGAISLGNIVSSLATDAFSMVKNSIGGLFTAADEAATQQAQLGAALQSTGDASGMSADQINALAEKQAKLTPISKDSTLALENMELTFTSITKNTFPQATAAIEDMATRMNNGLTPSAQQLSDTAIQVGKALQDPVKGIVALHRVGVEFTDQQKEQIKTMMAAGDQAGAQKLIIGELNKEFGGSAAASAKTYAGHLEQIKNNMHEAQVQIGTALETAFAPLAAKLADFVSSDQFQQWLKDVTTWLSVNLPKAIDFITHTILPLLKQAWDNLYPSVKFVYDIFKTIGEWMLAHRTTMKELAKLVLAIVVAFKGMMFVKGMINDIKNAWALFQILLDTSPIILIIGAIILVLVLLATHFTQVKEVAEAIWKKITQIVGDFVDWLKRNWPLILAILTGPFGLAILWIVTHWGDITDFFQKLPGVIGKFLSGIFDAITSPFKKAFDWIKKTVGGVGDALSHLNPFAKHSPSLVENIQAGTAVIIDQYDTMFKKIKDMPGAGLFNGANGNITLSGTPGQQMKFANITLNGDINFKNQDDIDYFFKKLGRNTQLATQGLTGVR